MGKVTERDIEPSDTAAWPDALVGQPTGGPGSASQPLPGDGRVQPPEVLPPPEEE